MNDVYVLPIGVINIPSGKTQYDWGIYDNFPTTTSVFLTDENMLLYAQSGTFKVGDVITNLRGNDSRRVLKRNVKILATSLVIKEDVMAMLKKHGYDYTPLRPFQKRTSGNRKLKTSYSVK